MNLIKKIFQPSKKQLPEWHERLQENVALGFGIFGGLGILLLVIFHQWL